MSQQAVNKPEVVIVHPTQVPSESMSKPGSHNVTVKYLIDGRNGSDRFSLRMYTVMRGGNTPLDQHAYEHQVYVLRGQGVLRISEEENAIRPISAGDVIFIPSNAVHQFINQSDEPLVFLCVKGNPALYSTNASPTGTDVQERNYC